MPNKIDASMLANMFIAGANYLSHEKNIINELNVFPVPDGDTGTNMTLTIMSAVDALNHLPKPTLETISKAISSGSLRGARGNSGVILSQLFRGFTKVIKDKEELDAILLAQAMNKAVDTAYKAVMKPKEGTILTVAKAMAVKAAEIAPEAEELAPFFETILVCGEETLERTPDMLPVLKEAGVVDSGGKGLMTILHGCVDEFNGVAKDFAGETEEQETSFDEAAEEAAPGRKTEHIETDDIKFGYCTEFIILLEKPFGEAEEKEMKDYLNSIGDSLVLVADEDVVKIHVHTNDPGLALQKGLAYGQLTRLKIDNMREEHKETLFRAKEASEPGCCPEKEAEKAEEEQIAEREWKEYGFVGVAAGEGLAEIFRELGCDAVISGGQSMNPCTDDFLKAIEEVHARCVYLLPNNKNIVLAANQARDLTEDCKVYVIPTKTVPQGISALVSFIRENTAEQNFETMSEEIGSIASGEVTYAIRDTQIDGKKITQGDIIGIGDRGLLAVGTELFTVIKDMIGEMTDEDSELISIYTGQDFPDGQEDALRELLEAEYPDMEIEVAFGGQPVYYSIISVE